MEHFPIMKFIYSSGNEENGRFVDIFKDSVSLRRSHRANNRKLYSDGTVRENDDSSRNSELVSRGSRDTVPFGRINIVELFGKAVVDGAISLGEKKKSAKTLLIRRARRITEPDSTR